VRCQQRTAAELLDEAISAAEDFSAAPLAVSDAPGGRDQHANPVDATAR